MPKYILIGLGIPLIIFLTMYLWSKLSEKTKNKTVTSIFGLVAITFIVLLTLLIF